MWYFKGLIIMAWKHGEITIESEQDGIPSIALDDLPEFIKKLESIRDALQAVENKKKEEH